MTSGTSRLDPAEAAVQHKDRSGVPVSRLRRTAVKLEKARSHLDFISLCLKEGLVPNGFSINWRCHLTNAGQIDRILRRTEIELMVACKHLLTDKLGELD